MLLASAAQLRETDRVAEFCTCGARLPHDAHFCHKCGKPQFEMPVPQAEFLPAAPIEALRAHAQLREGINFRNRTAVRVGLLAAALASLLISLPMPMYVNIVWLLAWLVSAGFFAVYLYSRRTGQELSVRMGARMGWITGVFCFAIATIFFTITVFTISSQGSLGTFYREQLGTQAGPDVNLEEVLEVLESPAGVAAIIFFTLLLLFFLFTLLPTLGGALGAKVLEKD